MDMAAAMEEIASRLDTIEPLRTLAWPAGTITPPGGLVGYPTNWVYDDTPGKDVAQLPVVLVVGNAKEKSTRDAMARYVAGTGASSVAQVLESGVYTAFETLIVKGWDYDSYDLAGATYAAAIFDLEITGPK